MKISFPILCVIEKKTNPIHLLFKKWNIGTVVFQQMQYTGALILRFLKMTETLILVFRTVMHSLHIIDVPLYIVVIIVLFKIDSNVFQTYKFYLIWHTLM